MDKISGLILHAQKIEGCVATLSYSVVLPQAHYCHAVWRQDRNHTLPLTYTMPFCQFQQVYGPSVFPSCFLDLRQKIFSLAVRNKKRFNSKMLKGRTMHPSLRDTTKIKGDIDDIRRSNYSADFRNTCIIISNSAQ